MKHGGASLDFIIFDEPIPQIRKEIQDYLLEQSKYTSTWTSVFEHFPMYEMTKKMNPSSLGRVILWRDRRGTEFFRLRTQVHINGVLQDD